MWWPSASDPFYVANTVDNTARRNYYGVSGVPTMKCDGGYCGTSQYAISSAINARLTIPAHIWLDLILTVNGADLNVTCNAVADMNISGNVCLHTVLLDRYSYLPGAPSGQPNHYHAMLEMVPSNAGQAFSATAFDTVHYYATIPLDPTWALENLDLSCFVQNNSTKEVLQAKVASIPLDFPNILLTDYEVSDPTGNGDGRVDPGETGEMVVTLENQIPFHDAEQVVATLATEDSLIDVIVPLVNFPDIASGASASNSADPFEFYVDSTFEAHEVTFTVTVTAEPGSFEATYPVTFMVGRPAILLVNDDLNGGHQSWYEESLSAIGRVFDAWNQVELGALPEEEMNRYSLLIWYTGDDATATISPDEQAKIETFMNSGGRFFLSSQNAGDVLGGTSFYQDVLRAQHLENSTGEYLLDGVPGDPVSDGTSVFLVGASGAGNANSSSSLNPLAPAAGIYTYTTAGSFGALRCETETTRFVYFALAFEAVSGMVGTTPRSEILENSLSWLEGELAVDPAAPDLFLPEHLELSGIHPNPFNPSADIEFSLPAASFVQLQIFDLQGKLISALVSGTIEAGRHTVRWNAALLSSGIYIVALKNGPQIKTTKAVLLK